MARIGVLGAGQLGRMLGLAGIALGQEFRFFDPTAESPAQAVGPLQCGSYDDEAKLREFARDLDVVTYEFENVPMTAAQALARSVNLFPPPKALEIAQNRFLEKSFFRQLGISTAKFVLIAEGDTSQQETALRGALAEIRLPAVLKTTRMGYDGKGQYVLREEGQIAAAAAMLHGREGILEQFVTFSRELSIIAVRGKHGDVVFYPLVENIHHHGILRTTAAPAPDVSPALRALAEKTVSSVADALGYVGALSLELFQCDDQLFANEFAPRVHNSGHWSIEGAETSQFENHIRAILGLPLGSAATRGLSLMVNLIGHLPDPAAVLAIPGAHLHVYGKAVKPGRKVGHITIHAKNESQLRRSEGQLKTVLERDGYCF